MPIEYRPDGITLAQLAPDPQYTADLDSLSRLSLPKPIAIVLDFTAVRYMNSSNLAKLLRLRKQLIELDGRLVLCGMTPQILGLFTVTGLDKVFNIVADVEQALEKLPV